VKALAAVILIFAIVIGCVVIASVDFGEKQARDQLPQLALATVSTAPAPQCVAPAPVTPARSITEAPNRPATTGSPTPATRSAAAITPPVTPKSDEDEMETPEDTEPETPKTRIVYVPQIIERVYVREVYHTREVVHEPARNDESVASEPRYSNHEGAYFYEHPSPMNRYANFIEEARSRCHQCVPCADVRCNQYQGTSNSHPCLRNFGGGKWN